MNLSLIALSVFLIGQVSAKSAPNVDGLGACSLFSQTSGVCAFYAISPGQDRLVAAHQTHALVGLVPHDTIGTTTGGNRWDFKIPVIFGFCDPNGCHDVDVLNVHYYGDITYQHEAHLSGELVTQKGYRIDLTGHTCQVMHDIAAWPDQQVGFYRECGTSYNMSSYQVHTGTSTGMEPDTNNYWAIGIQFQPKGSDRHFVFNWESTHWYMDNTGNQRFR